MNDDFQILGDGTTVWVNTTDGSCIGRFGRMIIDVHHDAEAQAEGKHCLACAKRSDDLDADWTFFKEKMQEHYGLAVPDRYRPSA